MVDYEFVCYRCGCAITLYDVGSYVEGTFVDFSLKEVGTIHVYYCRECTESMKEIAIAGLEGVIQRTKNFEDLNTSYDQPRCEGD